MIYIVKLSAMNGKITSLLCSERMGQRLKAHLQGVVWFARELPWRHGRMPTVTGVQVRIKRLVRIWVVPRKDLPFVPIRDGGFFYLFFTHGKGVFFEIPTTTHEYPCDSFILCGRYCFKKLACSQCYPHRHCTANSAGAG